MAKYNLENKSYKNQLRRQARLLGKGAIHGTLGSNTPSMVEDVILSGLTGDTPAIEKYANRHGQKAAEDLMNLSFSSFEKAFKLFEKAGDDLPPDSADGLDRKTYEQGLINRIELARKYDKSSNETIALGAWGMAASYAEAHGLKIPKEVQKKFDEKTEEIKKRVKKIFE